MKKSKFFKKTPSNLLLKEKSKLIKINYLFLTIFVTIVISLSYVFIFKYNKNQNGKENIKINVIKSKSFLSKKSMESKEFSEEFINELKNILKDDELIENEIMDKHTTFRIGGPARFFAKPKKIEQIGELIKLCNKYNVYYFILGNGSNLLVSDTGYKGVIIQIHEHNFANLEVKKKNKNTYELTVGAGMLMKNLAIETCLLSLTGLEDIIDIPGTVGGGVIMNASFRGTGLRIPLEKVKVISPEGKLLELTKEECGLKWRGSMLKEKKYAVIEATFILKKGDQLVIQKSMTENTRMRYERQPMYFRSAGTFFIWNKKRDGGLYDKYVETNLVSYKVGDCMIYTDNISFIVNLGNGNANEVMEIVNHVGEIFKKKYNIEMRNEVVVIGTIKGVDYYF